MTITEYYIIDSIEKRHFRKQTLSDDEFLQKLLETNKRTVMLDKDPKELAEELVYEFGKDYAKKVCKKFVDLGLYLPLSRFQVDYFSNVMQAIEKL